MNIRIGGDQGGKGSDNILTSLVGRTIVVAKYIPAQSTEAPEGAFELTLDDQRVVCFASSGDDMTYTYMEIYS